MNADMIDRLDELVARGGQRTQGAKIRAQLPRIRAAREAGATWKEICAAIGVARSSLFAAIGKLDEPAGVAPAGRTPTQPRPSKTEQIPSKVSRWPKKESIQTDT